MILAPPIVSQAASFLTKLFSAIILLTENAKERVTASGNPSGIATIRIVIEIKKMSKNVFTCSPANLFSHPCTRVAGFA